MILTLLPAILVGAVASIAIAVVGALILMRIVPSIDAKTAALATMPGGVIEMANIAKRIDADPLPIMVLQTMRVGLTVCAAPFVVTALAEAGARNVVTHGEVMSWLTVIALMGASFVGGFFPQPLHAAERLVPRLAVRDGGARRRRPDPGRVPDSILVVAQVDHRHDHRHPVQARVPDTAVAPAAGVAGDSAVRAGDAGAARRALFRRSSACR